MTGLWIILAVLFAFGGFVVFHKAKRRETREALRLMRLSPEDTAQLEENFPIWRCLPETVRASTEGWIHVFLEEKSFEACGGLESVTREMKLAIAAPACLLIANRPQDYYERLRSVLVYPGAYRAEGRQGAQDVRLGESWGTGSVVLSWKSVLKGDSNPEDGLNVVLHEFAHQLDQEDGAADGVPEFEEGEDYGKWSRAFGPAYQEFCERVEKGKRSVIDDYGAESPAEFFAVVTETFFERSKALKEEEPRVYEELVRFYGMDPSEWTRGSVRAQ